MRRHTVRRSTPRRTIQSNNEKHIKTTQIKTDLPTGTKIKTTEPKHYREFWSLFSNVTNDKFELVMQQHNYLDEFIVAIETMHPEDYAEIVESEEIKYTIASPPKWEEVLKQLRLGRYTQEVKYLRKLVKLQKKGKPVDKKPAYGYSNGVMVYEPAKAKTVSEQSDIKSDPAESMKDCNDASEELAQNTKIRRCSSGETSDSESVTTETETKNDNKVEFCGCLLHGNVSEIKEKFKSILGLAGLNPKVETTNIKQGVDGSNRPSFIIELNSSKGLLLRAESEMAKRQSDALRKRLIVEECEKRIQMLPDEKKLKVSTYEEYRSLIQDSLEADRNVLVMNKIFIQAQKNYLNTDIEMLDEASLAKAMDNIQMLDLNSLWPSK